MSNLFSKTFYKVLTEEDQPINTLKSVDDLSDTEAMASTLDPGTSPEDFDINAGSREAAVASAKSHVLMVGMLDEWIQKVTEFTNFLNDVKPNSNSIQSMLAKADEKSLFGVIKNAETKKVALVAKELAGLTQMLQGYRASAEDPKYKGS
jgi:hypothetical protein